MTASENTNARLKVYLKQIKADDGARLHGFLFWLCDNVGPYSGGSMALFALREILFGLQKNLST